MRTASFSRGCAPSPTVLDAPLIAAIPVYVYDVNLGDEVEIVETAEELLVATRVTSDAGRFTFRVWFPDVFPGIDGAAPDERWKALQVDLEPYGCWFDMYTSQLIAVSAEADVAAGVADFLAAGEDAGRFMYETGRTASPYEAT